MLSINIEELLKKENINIIDIRSRENYNNNHIPGAKNIPEIILIGNPGRYLDKNQTYYIYCQRGYSSRSVCKILYNMGYKTISINGGYEEWILKR